jgi:hypothetical protein
MTLPKILFLTNKQNSDPEEDVLLVDFLSNDFELIVSHPLDCLKFLNTVKGVIIRNIWPTYKYLNEWTQIEAVIRKTGIPTYNSLTGKADRLGKNYLLTLYKQGFPVIPSVDALTDIDLLGTHEFYWIKPRNSCDGIGALKLSGEELQKQSLVDYIIQPYIEFTSEPSFFFVDNKFSHAITTENRLVGKDMRSYQPTEQDLIFARKFIDWNNLKYGIQRIDAVRTKREELLLTEIEDFCPYLYINDIAGQQKQKFLHEIRNSMLKVFS